MADAVRRSVDAAILDYARQAKAKGKHLAVSPAVFGRGDGALGSRRFSVKHDFRFVDRNDPIHAGWTLYEMPADGA